MLPRHYWLLSSSLWLLIAPRKVNICMHWTSYYTTTKLQLNYSSELGKGKSVSSCTCMHCNAQYYKIICPLCIVNTFWSVVWHIAIAWIIFYDLCYYDGIGRVCIATSRPKMLCTTIGKLPISFEWRCIYLCIDIYIYYPSGTWRFSLTDLFLEVQFSLIYAIPSLVKF